MEGGGSTEPGRDLAREAFEHAVSALNHRARTLAEMSAWLGERGYEPDVVEDALGRLVEIGELDDTRFARLYAEDKRELRGWGSERIREALAARGVAPEAIEAAIAPDTYATQVDRAAGLLCERGHAVDTEPERARALAFLTRRGYDYEVAYEAIHRAERAGREAA